MTSLPRRRFLGAVAGAAVYVALRPTLSWAKHAARPLPPLQPWSLPSDPPGDPVELGRALASAAVLAPSHWNTQPWKIEVNQTSLRLLPDATRALPINDPDRCGLMMALGASLENVLVTLRAYRFRPVVTYAPPGEKAAAIVSWSRGEPRRDRDLLAAIPDRRTNRRTYDGRGLFMQNRSALSALVPSEQSLSWIEDRDGIRRVADLAYEATEERILDARAQTECWSWTRFGEDEARARADGVTIDDMEINGPARWLAKSLRPGSRFLGFVASSAAKQAREQVRSAGAVALLTAPGVGEASTWLMAGQTYERFALRATQLGIAHQPIHAPIERLRHRGELARAFGVVDERPLMLLRLGHAHRPRPSMRRGIALVASFRKA